MRILVAGGGAVGLQVARALQSDGNDVVVVERDSRRAAELANEDVEVVLGNACVATVLEAAGALRSDVLVACTGRDEENLVISRLAKLHLEVPRVVARVNRDNNRWLFDRRWGIDAAISASAALVALIEEATGSARLVHLAEIAAGLVLVEAAVVPGCLGIGRSPLELDLAVGDVVAAVIRRGRSLTAEQSGPLESGDRVLFVTSPASEDHLHAALFGPVETGSDRPR